MEDFFVLIWLILILISIYETWIIYNNKYDLRAILLALLTSSSLILILTTLGPI